MECPHLIENCKINRDIIKTKKCQLIDRLNGQQQQQNDIVVGVVTTTTTAVAHKIWQCTDCLSTRENWICLYCGAVLCGRYEKAHALNHFNTKDHKICMNTLDYSVFCYKCDDFIINEIQEIDNIRKEFKTEIDKIENESSSSLEDKWVDEQSLGVSRKLRPRKRTISSDSNEGSAKKKSLRKVVGLRNLGNTCFMNSVLQSLSNIQEFSYYFSTLPCLDTNHKQKPQQQQRVYHSRSLKENLNDANVVEELRKILLNLSKGGDGTKAISPECLFLVIWKVVPQFRGHRQHDAHEFLRYLLDRLHTELEQNCNNLNTLKNGRSSIVTNVFGGTLQSEVRCLICGMESKKHDPFLDLSLDIPEKYYKYSDDNNTTTTSLSGDIKSICNINDCLSSFIEVEELTETELYYCSSCKCKQKSTKRFWIRRLPNVLCLHIKRFRWNNFFRTKIDLRISFPITSLDMSQYVLNHGPETRHSQTSNVFDLAAVIVHHGNGSSCGHYTAFAMNNGTWLHFNDQTVKEVPSSAVAECKPYILFYIRRDAGNNKT